MSLPAIEIDGLAKRYRIGDSIFNYGRLSESIARGVMRPFRGRTDAIQDQTRTIWALDDVTLDVMEGSALGIVGHNGAGKSTLLKVMSRITTPTRGEVRLHGRVGSLLEVGTGFHPELTGRENVSLNGAILGMRRSEIERKFDEIVAFAGVERFIDTPVKRYSSGMYVRLAFAVAAHLETEILIVDEVLAVGDVEFQRRCLGKLKDVATTGRTVVFVSHQLAAVTRLCDHAVWLDEGRVRMTGTPEQVIGAYLKPLGGNSGVRRWHGDDRPGSGPIRLEQVALLSRGVATTTADSLQPIQFELTYELLEPAEALRVGFVLNAGDGTTVFMSKDQVGTEAEPMREPARYTSVCTIPGHLLNEGAYSIAPSADQPNIELFHVPNAIEFDVVRTGGVSARDSVRWPGVILPDLAWQVMPAAAER
jgi:lipopolysaccharide transport system ATP-binding protein